MDGDKAQIQHLQHNTTRPLIAYLLLLEELLLEAVALRLAIAGSLPRTIS